MFERPRAQAVNLSFHFLETCSTGSFVLLDTTVEIPNARYALFKCFTKKKNIFSMYIKSISSDISNSLILDFFSFVIPYRF